MASYWKDGIDRFLDTEFKPLDATEAIEPPKKRDPLTKELAAKM